MNLRRGWSVWTAQRRAGLYARGVEESYLGCAAWGRRPGDAGLGCGRAAWARRGAREGLGRTAAVRSGPNRHDHGSGYPIVSIMCSTVEGRLALIGEAIDDVAAALSAGELSGAGAADVAARLARIWAMLAELDPALAGRLRDYSLDGE